MSDESIQEIKRVFVEEARSDTVGLWLLASWVKEDLPSLSDESAKRMTLEIIRESLDNGDAVAGDFMDGAMFGTTDVVGLVNEDGSPASVITLPYFAAGAGVGFEIDILSDRLALRLAADYLGVLSRPLFTIDHRTLYQTGPFSMAIGGGLGVFF